MLTSETKQKIQNLRDTLVGKIPVPTEQVKQITLGFIYKFMSDIDQENKELGSKSFFGGDYEKYSWHKIMDRGLSSYDRVLLYSEGLEKMALNPNIPQLFRDIFKGAFLPFRDPAIVNEFLKGINEFKYEHSEDLGDAFEFLLMVMDAQGDAGQFRTPRHIIDFIVQAVEPQKNDKILDPACGTAGFLVGAYKHILKQNTVPNSNRPGSALTTTQRNNLSKNFVGYDISHDMVRLSLVNMYLHQFSEPKIYEYDTLTSLDRWEDNFDCVLANPPFMTPRGGIRPHNRFAIRANRSEVLFVDYIAEHLNPSGKAGIIVPEGIIFQSANAYKALRKMLVDNGYLYAVVSLPAGVFNPYSGVKTSILLIDKTLAKKTKDILFVKIESDGFDLGAQRRPIDKNDLPQACEVIKQYKQLIIEGKDIAAIKKKSLAHIVSKSETAGNQDYILSSERYKKTTLVYNGKWEMFELGELCDIFNGSTPLKKKEEYWEKGTIPWFTIEDIREQGHIIYKTEKFITQEALKETSVKLLPEYTVLLCCTASVGEYAFSTIKLTTNQQFNGLVVKAGYRDKLSPKFLFWCASNLKIELERLSGKTSFNFVSVGTLKKLKILLPPLEIQQEIVAELDGYQKIIDGAKQVVENYNPQIKIDSKWITVDIEQICDLVRGSSPRPQGDSRYYGGNVPRLMVSDVTRDGMYVTPRTDFLTEEGAKLSRPMNKGEVVMAVSGNPGLPSILNVDACIHDGFVGFRNLDSKIMPEFLYFVLLHFKQRSGSQSIGAVFKNLTTDQIKKFKIPLPSIETQKQIVAQIEEEQKLIEANKKLIEVFEQKVKDKIREIWGEK